MEKFKGLRQCLDIMQVGPLGLRIVEIVQVIERPHGVAVVEQTFANVRADEACRR